MSTLHAEDVPLPQSRQSPIARDETLGGDDLDRQEEEGGAADLGNQETPADRSHAEADIEGGIASRETRTESGVTEVGEQGGDSHIPDTVEEKAPDTAVASTETTHADPTAQPDLPQSSHKEDERDERDERDYDDDKPSSQAASVPSLARAPTPSSRTSTPPLAPGAIPKKFASVNVNKKFLSKTVTPASGSPVLGSKLGSLSGTSPVPSTTTSSRLLSTKLTTVPSNKTSTSPQPPGPSSATPPATSPWAKPQASPAESSSPGPGPNGKLHQPAPTRARVLTTTPTVMGSGIGIGGSTSKTAWRPVASDGKRTALGLSRDFPTAKEVAEGKREAQVLAQAKAAQNQAILQGLNAFTQLDPNAHRWEDEDDDDEVIDFGDGSVYPHHDHHASREPVLDQPVPKNERFAEDFDRSWPRQRPLAPEQASGADNLSRRDQQDRVLFNANSNRMESSTRPAPPAQPTRLLPRLDSQHGTEAGSRHPISNTAYPSADSQPNRPTQSRDRLPPPPNTIAPSRQPWPTHEEISRPEPTIHHQRGSGSHLPSDHSRFGPNDVQRRSFSQTSRPQPPSVSSEQPPQPAPIDPASIIDAQAAEMHTAAEKARLRRLAEEQEREVAAERARQKAKELEERFGKKESKPKEQSASAPGPSLATVDPAPRHPPQPAYTLAQRGTPVDGIKTALPQRPSPDSRYQEGSWRRPSGTTVAAQRGGEAGLTVEDAPAIKSEVHQPRAILSQPRAPPRQSQVVESEPMLPVPVENQVEPAMSRSPEKGARRDKTFDNMLARIQAAMDEARANPVLLPGPDEPNVEDPSARLPSSPQRPAAIAVKPRPPVSEYFNVSRIEIPKSPPPAWRTYTVRIPKVTAKRPAFPASRLKSFQIKLGAPRGWHMSFVPAIEGLNLSTQSRSELLLPQPVQRRFARFVDPGPIVSISPRKLRPFERKKKRVYDTPKSDAVEDVQTMESAAALLGDIPDFGSAATTSKGPAAVSGASTSERWSKADAPPNAKSPVESAAKAEKDGMFEGVGIGIPERAKALSDAKPGVRFMVSSELEGDSLLDEVNKISLETVGEGSDEKIPEEAMGRRNAPNSDAPKTPPSLSTSARVGPSPNGTTGTWSNAPGAAQHDHIKSVWEHTPTQTSDPSSRNDSSALSLSGHGSAQLGSAQYPTSTQTSENTTPMYPSLNAPSSSETLAQQAMPIGPQSKQMGYSHSHSSQPFSPSSTACSSQAPVPYAYSPDHLSHAHQSHQGTNNLSNLNLYRSGSGMNGYAQHQTVWSPTAFGTGYGYTKTSAHAPAIPTLESKTASTATFSATPGKESYGNGNDYRAFHAAQQTQAQGHPAQPQTTHNFTAAAAAAAAYNRNTVSTPVNAYGYYGAPGGGRGGQFGPAAAAAQANGDYYGSVGTMEGGYYGGLGGGYAYGQSGMPSAHGQAHGAGAQLGHHLQGGRGLAAQRKTWGG